MKHLLTLFFFLSSISTNAANQEAKTTLLDFAKTYGIVRYFSPNPYVENWSESDWYKVCAYLVSQSDSKEINELFEPLCHGLVISNSAIDSCITGDTNKASVYEYHGSGSVRVPLAAKILYPGVNKYVPYYRKYLPWQTIQNGTPPEPFKYYSYRLPSGKYCNIIHCDSEASFSSPKTKKLLKDAEAYWESHKGKGTGKSKIWAKAKELVSDKDVILADLIVRWNIIRHFYPYYNDEQVDWDKQLLTFINNVEEWHNDQWSFLQWFELIRQFLNPVKDGHIIIQNGFKITKHIGGHVQQYYADGATYSINDTVLIVSPSINGGKPAILDSINHISALSFLQDKEHLFNASTDKYKRYRASSELISAEKPSAIEIVFHPGLDGVVQKDTIHIKAQSPTYFKDSHLNADYYDADIAYINVTSSEFSYKTVSTAIDNGYEKIIFDLRGYPSYDFEKVLKHLLDKDVPYLRFDIPIATFPFQKNLSYESKCETIEAQTPTFKGRFVFLCNETTISWGETILMLVKGYSLGTIIGDHTAGTNGDATTFQLPMFPFTMTGLRVVNLDESKHHTIGIKPDIIVHNSAAGIMAGRDEVLETAINYLK